jgi:hypothetical protein
MSSWNVVFWYTRHYFLQYTYMQKTTNIKVVCNIYIVYNQLINIFAVQGSHSLAYAVYAPWSDGPPLTVIYAVTVKSRDSVYMV